MESINYKALYENMLEEHNKIKSKLEEIIKMINSLDNKIKNEKLKSFVIPDLNYVM